MQARQRASTTRTFKISAFFPSPAPGGKYPGNRDTPPYYNIYNQIDPAIRTTPGPGCHLPAPLSPRYTVHKGTQASPHQREEIHLSQINLWS